MFGNALPSRLTSPTHLVAIIPCGHENIREAFDRLSLLDERVSAIERSTPAGEGEEMPAFVQRQRDAIAAQPAPPTVGIERVEGIERSLAELRSAIAAVGTRPAPVPLNLGLRLLPPEPVAPPVAPMVRIEIAAKERLSSVEAPPLRVVEAAHLARNGQSTPVRLMERIGGAMGCSWEEAARAVISQHDAAAMVAAEVYALQCEARKRVADGEDERAVSVQTVEAIGRVGVGDNANAAVDT